MNIQLGLIKDTGPILDTYTSQAPCCICFDVEHTQSYLPGTPVITLTAALLFDQEDVKLSIANQTDVTLSSESASRCYNDVLKQMDSASLSLNEPWPLETLKIDKPWGQEIWYTGIETRGICKAGGIPLPWLLDIFPEQILGQHIDSNPILLKILDPLPSESVGDMYFELHQEKIEVYVVTHVDKHSWPDGQGKMRYGFNQSRLSAATSAEEFKADYLAAVKDYQLVRDQIDSLLDQLKLDAGLDIKAPVSAEQLPQWTRSLDPDLIQAEHEKKQLMYSFTQLETIEVGDVIRVVPFVPHSLQHGVRVIEFQTAHYERSILSFTQKVLTQSHWDTQEALTLANTTERINRDLLLLDQSETCRVEVVADFPQFKAIRVTLEPNEHTPRAEYSHNINSYGIVIGVSGHPCVNGLVITPESALFVSSNQGNITLSSDGEKCILLVAIPNQSD